METFNASDIVKTLERSSEERYSLTKRPSGTKSVGEMSITFELSSVAARLPGTSRRSRIASRPSLRDVKTGTQSGAAASEQARESFISQCTRQSLQVWQQGAHFESDEVVSTNRVHSPLRQEEEYAKTAEGHRGLALVDTDTAHRRKLG